MRPAHPSWPVILLVLAVVGGALVPGHGHATTTDATTTDDPALAEAARLLRHADTCYWFALSEQGDMATYRRALAFVARAHERLAAADTAATGARALRRLLAAREADLAYQMDMAHDTFVGVFPLARFMNGTVFLDAGVAGSYEFIDEPDVVAACRAAETLARRVLLQNRTLPQYPAVFNSVPRAPDLENEVRFIFNADPRFYVHTAADVASVLDDAQLAAFRSGVVDSATAARLMDLVGEDQLVVATLHQLDVLDGDHFHRLDATLYTDGPSRPSHTLSQLSVCRDRRAVLPLVVALNGILLLLAIALYALIVKRHTFRWPRWRPAILAPLLGFLAGRVTPWLVFTATSGLRPAPETLAILSFWWTALAGLVVVVGPPLLVILVSRRVAAHLPTFDLRQKGAAVAVATGLGTSAYLAAPLMIYLGARGTPLLLAAVVVVGAVSYLVGRALDTHDAYRPGMIAVPLLLATVLGPALMSARLELLLLCAAVALIALAVQVVADRRARRSAASVTTIVERSDAAPTTVPELVARCSQPPFLPTAGYAQFARRVRRHVEAGHGQVVLTGARGVGKTAMLDQLVHELESEEPATGVQVLRCACPDPAQGGSPPAYAPFQQAISARFGINLLGDAEDQLDVLDGALEEIVGSFVPLGGLLFPASDARVTSTSPAELHHSVSDALASLADAGPVLLVVDDVQWLDDASRALLRHLLQRFTGPVTDGSGVVCVLAGHDGEEGGIDDVLEAVAFAGDEMTSEPFTDQKRAELLQTSLGLAPDSAWDVVAWLADKGSFTDQGELHWLLQVVASLASTGGLRRERDGWTLASREALSIPPGMRQAVRERLAELGDDRVIVELAACSGLRFRVQTLATSLGLDRLELLQRLERIEEATGLLADVRAEDDVFAFRSSFVLDVIREEFALVESGPLDSSPRQVVREYHAKMARSLERHMGEGSAALYAVANHYYAAGRSHLPQALATNLAAARAATRTFAHEEARDHLERARQCADILGKTREMAEDFLQVELHAAHLRNEARGAQRAAEAADALLTTRPRVRPETAIAMARAFYDVLPHVGPAERPRWLGRGLATASALAGRDDVPPLVMAEAKQFQGLFLPLDDRPQRERLFREALALLGDPEPPRDDPQAAALFARVLDSLAGELWRMADRDWREAEAAYLDSLLIKSRKETWDLPGQARGCGGLGRLRAYRLDRRDLAAPCFARDLEIAAKIGDLSGQVIMHSELGLCALDAAGKAADPARRHELLAGAEESFRASLELADSDIARIYARLGLLEAAAARADMAAGEREGRALAELLAARPLPRDCQERLTVVVTTLGDAGVAGGRPDWLDGLADALPGATS
jgi:hypothetical protein